MNLRSMTIVALATFTSFSVFARTPMKPDPGLVVYRCEAVASHRDSTLVELVEKKSGKLELHVYLPNEDGFQLKATKVSPRIGATTYSGVIDGDKVQLVVGVRPIKKGSRIVRSATLSVGTEIEAKPLNCERL